MAGKNASSDASNASKVSRRSFVNASAATVGALAAPASAAVANANSRVRIGFIGPGGRGFGAHVKTLAKLHNEGLPVDLVAVSEVYKKQEDTVCSYIKEQTGRDLHGPLIVTCTF